MWICFDFCTWKSHPPPSTVTRDLHSFLTSCTLSRSIYWGILALWIDLGEMNEI